MPNWSYQGNNSGEAWRRLGWWLDDSLCLIFETKARRALAWYLW